MPIYASRGPGFPFVLFLHPRAVSVHHEDLVIVAEYMSIARGLTTLFTLYLCANVYSANVLLFFALCMNL